MEGWIFWGGGGRGAGADLVACPGNRFRLAGTASQCVLGVRLITYPPAPPPPSQPRRKRKQGVNFRRKFFLGLPFWVWGFLCWEKSKERVVWIGKSLLEGDHAFASLVARAACRLAGWRGNVFVFL